MDIRLHPGLTESIQTRRTPSCLLETLEHRRLLSATFPSATEQYMLALINRARANPAAEAARDGIDLNEGLPAGTISAAPKQPLAFNPDLINSAQGHSQWMIDNQLFQHDGPGSTDPGQRMQAAGYDFAGTYGWGENIAEEGSTGAIETTSTTDDEENNLFIDSTETGRGHRVNIEDADFQEIGVGIATGTFNGYNAELTTQDFAYSGASSNAGAETAAFLTGVAFNDGVMADHFYEPGEGLGAITITATRASDHAVFSTQTWASGGYTLALTPGAYQITAAGQGLKGTVSGGTVSINAQNVEVDFDSTLQAPVITPPAAALSARTLKTVASAYTFDITYTSSEPLNPASFDKHNLTITGPDGFRESATFVATKSSNGGKAQVVTYRLAAPIKKWRSSNNGVYHVYVRPNQIADLSGDFVAAALLGYFKVKIA